MFNSSSTKKLERVKEKAIHPGEEKEDIVQTPKLDQEIKKSETTTRVFYTKRLALSQVFELSDEQIVDMTALPEKQIAIVVDEALYIYDLETDGYFEIRSEELTNTRIINVFGLVNNQLALSTYRETENKFKLAIFIIDLKFRKIVRVLPIHEVSAQPENSFCAVAQQERTLVVGTKNGKIEKWDPNTGKCVNEQKMDGSVERLASRTNGHLVAAIKDESGQFSLHVLDSSKQIYGMPIDEPIRELVVLNDDTLVWYGEKFLCYWNPENNHFVTRPLKVISLAALLNEPRVVLVSHDIISPEIDGVPLYLWQPESDGLTVLEDDIGSIEHLVVSSSGEIITDMFDVYNVVKRLRPTFVVNSAVYVPSDTETDSSDDEVDDGNPYEFEEEDFDFDIDDAPFKINSEKRGSLAPEVTVAELKDIPVQRSQIRQRILDKLSQEGFKGQNQDPVAEAQTRLSASFGLNRPKSLSSGKNKALLKECAATLEAPAIANRHFGFFWDYKWERKKDIGKGKRSPLTTYQEVHSFYKQLKQRDPSLAREFRRANENQPRNSMVPYREVRETVKNHSSTTILVQRARARQKNIDVYLSFVDGDTKSFSKDKEGIYTAYSRIHAEQKMPPEVMSTGYEYSDEKDHPLIQFASLLDRRVRTATARYVPRGVYYPEPNFCIRVPNGRPTVEESFLEYTPTGKVSKANYESPKESTLILDKVALRPNHTAVFASDSPLLTLTPRRAQNNKQGSSLSFNAKQKNQKFHDWVWHDVINVTRNIAQSHVKSRDWSIYLLNAYSCSEEISFGDLKIIDGALIRNIAISLLSRLFASYDPISMVDIPSVCAKENRDEKARFAYVLANYDQLVSESNISPSEAQRGKKKTLPLEKAKRASHKNTQAEKLAAWKIVDAYHTRDQIKAALRVVLVGCNPDHITAAASASGTVIKDTFKEYFIFSEAPAVRRQLNFSK